LAFDAGRVLFPVLSGDGSGLGQGALLALLADKFDRNLAGFRQDGVGTVGPFIERDLDCMALVFRSAEESIGRVGPQGILQSSRAAALDHLGLNGTIVIVFGGQIAVKTVG
jgi:hypothetical protein